MKAVIALEIIADNYYAYLQAKKRGEAIESRSAEKYGELLGRDKARPWVARITGLCATYGLKREFIRGQKDYSRANSIGSRGIYEYFALDSGIYEVHERTTWKKTRRYFIRVENAQIEEIDKKEVYSEINRPQNQRPTL